MSDILLNHKLTWNKKKILKVVYTSWYKMILKDLSIIDGKTLELGSGSGNFKEFKPDIITSDIESCDWLDMHFDAHHTPFENNSIGNIVMIDVLHHLSNPIIFLNEANRILKKSGKLIILEPYPTIFSHFIYKRFHPEKFIFDIDYFNLKEVENKDSWDSNQAISYLLFYKYKKKLMKEFGDKFKILKRKKISCILYPASGGFENKSMIPDFLIPLFQILEYLLVPFRWIMAFRCYIVMEKK